MLHDHIGFIDLLFHSHPFKGAETAWQEGFSDLETGKLLLLEDGYIPAAGQHMKRKERYIVRLDEVSITREGDCAVIQYKEAGILTTHLKIGPEIAGMSDEAILELFNDTLRAEAQLAAEYKHVAVEVPLGSPQIEYFARGYQWCPRGGVLRCLVEDDENRQLVVRIDDKELSLEEFGRMLTTYAGWGMRIEFVPDDQLHRRPALEVREPDPENEPEER